MTTTNPATTALESIFCETDYKDLAFQAKAILMASKSHRQPLPHRPVRIAPGATRRGVSPEHYHAYRRGLAAACADVVLIAKGKGEEDGKPKVALLRRSKPPFGNCWWVMGGVIYNYRPVQHFLLWKTLKECGLISSDIDDFVKTAQLSDTDYSSGDVHIVGCLGTYRTPAEDTEDPNQVCDTVNLCYMAIYTGTHDLRYDHDHTDARWFEMKDLTIDNCGHWYPVHVGQRAIKIFNDAEY